MTEPENPDVPDFDDDSFADIRALLADAAANEPMPAEVAAGLDDVLAGLVTERAAEADATVVPLRRRATIARRLLVAAAAVVLVGAGGVGVNQVLQNTNQSNDSTASGAGQQDLAPEAPAAGVPETALDGQVKDLDSLNELALGYTATRGRLAIQFTRAGFANQVTTLVRNADATGPWFDAGTPPADPDPNTSVPPPAAATAPTPTDRGLTGGGTTPGSGNAAGADSETKKLRNQSVDPQCPGPPVTDDVTVVPITFEGNPATLVLHPVVDGSRYVAAWSCDGHRLLAYTTVPG